MKLQQSRRRLLATTIIAGASALAFAAPAMAQDPGATNVDDLVVTGTRIARQDYVANSPISTVSAEQIQARGDVNVEQILNQLPQVVPGLSANSNNPSNGSATVDLRGLGASRTLVLVNGHRFIPYDKSNAVDLNSIPASLIERVEVVTGGASAVYGSDALAGVVNFIFKRDYEGFGLDTQYGISRFGDGEQFNASLTFGSNFADDRGNVTGFVGYSDRDGFLPNSDRPWSFPSAAGGSGTGEFGGLNNLALNPYTAAGCPTANPCRRSFRTTGVPGPFSNDFSLSPTSDRYDFSTVNLLQSPSERFNLALMGHYDVTDNVEAFAEVFYTDSRNTSQLAPTPATGISIPYSNFFVQNYPALLAYANSRPNPTAPLNFDRRMSEVGARIQNNNTDVYQINTGLRADLGSGWELEGYYSYGRTELTTSIQNDVSRSRLNAALAGGGTATSCAPSVLALFPTCVPINLFGRGTITPQAAAFVRLNFTDRSVFERQNVQLNLTGTVMELPAGPLGIAAGVEYREDTLSYTPDDAKNAGDIYGFNAERAVSGSSASSEAYVEAAVPLLRDAPFAKSLELELGARLSDYDTVGQVWSYKFGGSWEPVDSVRLRALYQRASRAPNVFELFQANDQGFPAVLDPCTTVNPGTGAARTLSAGVRNFCTAQLGFDPVTAGFVAQNTQTESFFFGNPDLSEEKSDTITVGAVWQPTFVDGLSMSLDYYKIEVEDYIGTISGGVSGIVGACFAAGAAASGTTGAPVSSIAECNNAGIGLPLIFRDAAGNLKARAPLGNVSALETSGVDFSTRYGWDVPWAGGMWGEQLAIAVNLTYLNSYELDGIEYAGTAGAYNISATLPEWKANVSLGYDVGPVRLAYSGTFIDELDNQGNIPDFQDGGYTGIDSYWYHDLSGTWQATENMEVFAGVRNLLDEEPPVFDNAPDGNTDPNAYDVNGRYFFFGARVKY
ncbi:TonB-dependent receptor plug domain-containing protein [Brevundimonas sp.]|uniref:TonB-dependent receptor plug domain-containing protein n=1 Tax=Brevundimonas sp. TaxID=1871086 RepID=UPI002ABBAF58|nr:TonB-dependent receptor [Brevundimonas sp.]MDZ4363539.1 TonB-dependent receptor [Brevundimonas sp.]